MRPRRLDPYRLGGALLHAVCAAHAFTVVNADRQEIFIDAHNSSLSAVAGYIVPPSNF
jgi:hypothetical protein